jgi:hypothetical protein
MKQGCVADWNSGIDHANVFVLELNVMSRFFTNRNRRLGDDRNQNQERK